MTLPCGGLFTVGNIFPTYMESTEQTYLLQLNKSRIVRVCELSSDALASMLTFTPDTGYRYCNWLTS